MTVEIEPPGPSFNADTEPFWRAAREGRLVVQYCPRTARYQHPPRPYMKGCGFDWQWREIPRTGEVYSFAVVHGPAHPAFPIPYVAAVVTMDEAGVRVVGQVREVAPGRVRIGMRVVVEFEAVGEIAVPYFVALEP